MPGTAGNGPGSFEITAEMPDITNIDTNSRVRVADITVGNVTGIQRKGWHAQVMMRLGADVQLPANATATVGQTSLLGSLHIELAPPKNIAPQGRLHNGSVIGPASSGSYPTTEQTLAALAALLSGGGLGQVQDITQALSTAFGNGRDLDLHRLLGQITEFVTRLDRQTSDIIAASEGIDNVAGQFADQQPVIDQALRTLPQAVSALKDRRDQLVQALDQLRALSADTADTVTKTKSAVVDELRGLGPVLQSLADSGTSLTRSLDLLATFPFPEKYLSNWVRGDYGNLTAVIDLTLSRIDSMIFTGTRWEGNLTELELQWGRTVGQMPSPYTAANPLTLPYHFNQGP